MPEAEDEAFAAGVGRIDGFAVLLFDAESSADSFVEIDEDEGSERWWQMHTFFVELRLKKAFCWRNVLDGDYDSPHYPNVPVTKSPFFS